jgi:hypothetical protein
MRLYNSRAECLSSQNFRLVEICQSRSNVQLGCKRQGNASRYVNTGYWMIIVMINRSSAAERVKARYMIPVSSLEFTPAHSKGPSAVSTRILLSSFLFDLLPVFS